MSHVATDNVSAPPAFTCSPFFLPFFPFNLFDSRNTVCRNGSAVALKFVAISAASGSGQAGIGAYSRRSRPVDQRHRVDAPSGVWQTACREKPSLRKCRGNIFELFVRTGEERLGYRSIYGASFQQTLGCA